MPETNRNIAVGLTAMVGLGGLLALLLLFGYVPGWLQPQGYRIAIELPNAAGLHQGSRVRFNGIDVGEVDSVRFRNDPSQGVIATATIRDQVRLPDNVKAQAVTSIFGGSPVIDLNAGPTQGATHYLPTTGSPPVIPGHAASLTNQVAALLKKPMAQFTELSKKLDALSTQWTTVGENMNKLIEPRTPSEVDSGKELGNLATVLARLDSRLASLKKLMADVQSVIGNKQFRQNLIQTVANAKTLSSKLNHDADTLTQTVQKNVNLLGKRYAVLADNISQAVTSLQKLADQATKGKGTLGKLLKDPSLYNNLNDAVHQLQAAADQAKLLLEKWKAEGVPVQF